MKRKTINTRWHGSNLAQSHYENAIGFTGRHLDSETDLYYFRARYYDTEQGRFISRDPAGYVDGLGLYNGYFATRFMMDPSGEICCSSCEPAYGSSCVSSCRSLYNQINEIFALTFCILDCRNNHLDCLANCE